MANFVLIHGAWHGGWVWRRVVDRLHARGHVVLAPTMTGLGERSHLLSSDITLETHILDFVRAVEWERLDNVVLCGHSLGGFVMTGVADRIAHRVSALVYLDAFVAQNGQSPLDLSPRWRNEEIAEAVRTKGDGWLALPEHVERWVEDPLDRAWVEALVTPHPFRSMSEPLRLTGKVDAITNRTYVLAERHRPSPFWQFYEILKDDPAWRTLKLPTLHDAMVSMPNEVAAILEQAAAA